MGTICINRSGQSFNVTESNAGGAVIATVAPNQVLSWISHFPGDGASQGDSQQVYCRGHSGTFVTGWIGGGEHSRVVESLINHSISAVDLEPDGRTEYTFKTRYPVGMYDKNGNYMETLPAGYMITTQEATAGYANKYWMHINSYGKSGPIQIGEFFIDIWSSQSMDFNMFPLIGTLR